MAVKHRIVQCYSINTTEVLHPYPRLSDNLPTVNSFWKNLHLFFWSMSWLRPDGCPARQRDLNRLEKEIEWIIQKFKEKYLDWNKPVHQDCLEGIIQHTMQKERWLWASSLLLTVSPWIETNNCNKSKISLTKTEKKKPLTFDMS